MKYTVEIRATSYTISPGSEAMDDLEELLDVLTYEDEFAEQTKTLGYLYDEPSDCLYIHKGVDPQYLKRLIPNCPADFNDVNAIFLALFIIGSASDLESLFSFIYFLNAE